MFKNVKRWFFPCLTKGYMFLKKKIKHLWLIKEQCTQMTICKHLQKKIAIYTFKSQWSHESVPSEVLRWLNYSQKHWQSNFFCQILNLFLNYPLWIFVSPPLHPKWNSYQSNWAFLGIKSKAFMGGTIYGQTYWSSHYIHSM